MSNLNKPLRNTIPYTPVIHPYAETLAAPIIKQMQEARETVCKTKGESQARNKKLFNIETIGDLDNYPMIKFDDPQEWKFYMLDRSVRMHRGTFDMRKASADILITHKGEPAFYIRAFINQDSDIYMVSVVTQIAGEGPDVRNTYRWINNK